MTTDSDRISRLEGINEEIRNRLTGMENRMNVQLGLIVTMWVTVIATVLLKG